MPMVVASIGITAELAEKCQLYHINRSAVSRAAIAQEIERIEKEAEAIAAKQNAPAASS